ncbi:NAF1-domain-containing protein [Myriangium duriaei CBS 260.36]|uniref:H/ACA ribonucleoprotein complex non-core subunit NAF1 n=1 Tax=Myriangium duriaei CBS 260.36 TaxID=1168546 RepID=A0A9P4IYC2_9PEZI|nr:NAF1-domain-containing protein [Myriangium duriaei CBS 260.36]
MSAEHINEDVPDDYEDLYGPEPSDTVKVHDDGSHVGNTKVAESATNIAAQDSVANAQTLPGIPGLTGAATSSSAGQAHGEMDGVETEESVIEAVVTHRVGVVSAAEYDHPTINHEQLGQTSLDPPSAIDMQSEVVSNDPNAQSAATNDKVTSQPLPKTQGDREFIEAAQANQDNPEAEWQYDSSDMDTSSSDSDSDSSSSDDSDADGDYEMLDPATAARMLMAEEAGDEEDGPSNKSGSKAGLKTKNEIEEVVIPKPDVAITENMKLVPLGKVENAVENLALIKGFTTGEYQVLEQGSVLCLEDRTVIGAVAETFGRVQEPLYSIAFSNREEIEQLGIKHGVTIFYVAEHSTFVFTQPLKGLKGTDASNIHDEEVGEDEAEFSDDEAERAHKQARNQAKKNHKAGLRDADAAPNGYHNANPDRKLISYDDVEDEDSRSGPSHGAAEQPRHGHQYRNFPDRGRGRGGRSRGSGRGRGNFGRDDRHRGGNHNGGRSYQQGAGTSQFQPPSTGSFTPPSTSTFTPPNPGSFMPPFPANFPTNPSIPQYNSAGWQPQAPNGQYRTQQQQQQHAFPLWPQPPQQSGQQYSQQQFPAPFPQMNPANWGQQSQPTTQPLSWPGSGQQNGGVPPPPPPNYQALLQNIELLRRMNGTQ